MSKKKAELTPHSFIKSYWNYFLEIEQQLYDIRRYIDFDSKNNNTFSMELLKLLQSICSEIDVVAKAIDSYVYNDFSGNNINHWGYYLQQIFPNLKDIIVKFNDDYTVQPWKNWEYIKNTAVGENNSKKAKKTVIKLKEKCKNPQWWTAYNKSKHERTSPYNNSNINYNRANLKNVVLSLSALYVIETLFREFIFEREKTYIDYAQSKLFLIIDNS